MTKLTAITNEDMKSISDLYRQTWKKEDPSVEERFRRHATYEGYKGLILKSNEEPVGFVYGYTSQKGQYYNELLRKALSNTEQSQWLEDCLEVVELVVLPEERRSGRGALLMTKLMEEVKHKTAILTTQVDNYAARGLYEKLGWHVVKEPFFPNTEEAYVVLGKKL
ncbi:GNAT family N-acetyltransferase [Radiobacillus deserti]|uniref:GNAT family N-acetyltransferase n=1 Tax=Radiobacillus deserti TaxID=2594883 RepID=A0A516KDV7_9BACI|nr:GNAT family N-acetyltransferase [Radiobacillus deserti]QDP39578.1 GNAT family N-acetyltransferase [Radiobacillus deserti]